MNYSNAIVLVQVEMLLSEVIPIDRREEHFATLAALKACQYVGVAVRKLQKLDASAPAPHSIYC